MRGYGLERRELGGGKTDQYESKLIYELLVPLGIEKLNPFGVPKPLFQTTPGSDLTDRNRGGSRTSFSFLGETNFSDGRMDEATFSTTEGELRQDSSFRLTLEAAGPPATPAPKPGAGRWDANHARH